MPVTKDLAHQFALILSAGVPQLDAIAYFFPDSLPGERAMILKQWLADDLVQGAVLRLQGKRWEEMTLAEKINYSIDKHYTELAYYLYSRNYSDLSGPERAKADTCRDALERKLAGMAGKVGALESFWGDVLSGKVKLAAQPKPLTLPSA